MILSMINILLRKTTAAQNEDALRYHRVRGLYFQAVVFVATMEYPILAIITAMPEEACKGKVCYKRISS